MLMIGRLVVPDWAAKASSGLTTRRLPSTLVNAESSLLKTEAYLGYLTIDAERFATAVGAGELTAPVDGCPGWDLRQLTVHQGVVHRWARHCVIEAAPPESTDQYEPDPSASADQLATWLLEGAADLVDALHSVDLDSPTWHPFPAPKLARVWPRRQAHETSIHRWDAEHAVGPTTPIEPVLASDGIDEYFDLMLRRRITRDPAAAPAGSLHLHCTDVEGEWLVQVVDGEYVLERAHVKGEAALRGPAEALLLRVWGRHSDRLAELSPVGDELVIAAWLG